MPPNDTPPEPVALEIDDGQLGTTDPNPIEEHNDGEISR